MESAAPAEAAPVEVPTGPAPPPAPAVADNSPLQAIGVVVHDDDDNRHLEVEITDDDGELDDKEEKAAQQDSYVATTGNTNLRGDDRGYIRRYRQFAAGASPARALREAVARLFGARCLRECAFVRLWPTWYSRASGAFLDVDRRVDGLPDHDSDSDSDSDGTIVDEHHAELCTGVLTSRQESPSPAAPDGSSATGRTCDDITKSPPPHLRCVVSPLSSLPPILRCTAPSPPRFCFVADIPGIEAGSCRALRDAATRLFGA